MRTLVLLSLIAAIAGSGCLCLTSCTQYSDSTSVNTLPLKGRAAAAAEDRAAVLPWFKDLATRAEGGASTNGVFSLSHLTIQEAEVVELASRMGLKEVKDRKDPDASNGTRGLESLAARFRTEDTGVRLFVAKNLPDSLKLSTGRRFEHAMLYHDVGAGSGLLQLGYGTMKEAKDAEGNF